MYRIEVRNITDVQIYVYLSTKKKHISGLQDFTSKYIIEVVSAIAL
jgi:hypothetical protein